MGVALGVTANVGVTMDDPGLIVMVGGLLSLSVCSALDIDAIIGIVVRRVGTMAVTDSVEGLARPVGRMLTDRISPKLLLIAVDNDRTKVGIGVASTANVSLAIVG